MIDDNSLKTQDIRLKLDSFDSIRITLQVDHKNMYLSLKNNFLFSKKRRCSCLSPTEHDILDMIDDYSSKTQDIRSKLVSFDSIRFTLQLDHKNMYFSLKNNLLFSKKHRSSCLSPIKSLKCLYKTFTFVRCT